VRTIAQSAAAFYKNKLGNVRRDSSVGIAAGYELDDRGVGVRVSGRVKNFLFSTASIPALRSTEPPIQWVPGREADHSPPASAEVKKMWLYTSTPPYAFMACLIS
jgi:hypothetical protein